MSEYNRDPLERDVREYRSEADEYHTAEERKYYSENAYSGDGTPSPQKKRRANPSAISRILTSFAVAAVAVVAVASSGVFAPKGSAEIVDVSVTDTQVAYDVTVEQGENLSIVLYNDFTKRQTALEQGENSGVFTGLKPGVSYTLAVVTPAAFGSGKTVAERSVKTELLPPPEPQSVWRGVAHVCTCAVDGYFHFTMDFDDPNGYFTDFSATLTDGEGNVSSCVFTEDLHAEQSIDVCLKAGLAGKRATFTLTYRTSDPSSAVNTVVYSTEVTI